MKIASSSKLIVYLWLEPTRVEVKSHYSIKTLVLYKGQHARLWFRTLAQVLYCGHAPCMFGLVKTDEQRVLSCTMLFQHCQNQHMRHNRSFGKDQATSILNNYECAQYMAEAATYQSDQNEVLGSGEITRSAKRELRGHSIMVTPFFHHVGSKARSTKAYAMMLNTAQGISAHFGGAL